MVNFIFMFFVLSVVSEASYKSVFDYLGSKQKNVDFLEKGMTYPEATRAFLKRIPQSEILKDYRVWLHEDLTIPQSKITSDQLFQLQRACEIGCAKGDILASLIFRMGARQHGVQSEKQDILMIYTHSGSPPAIVLDDDDGKWEEDE